MEKDTQSGIETGIPGNLLLSTDHEAVPTEFKKLILNFN